MTPKKERRLTSWRIRDVVAHSLEQWKQHPCCAEGVCEHIALNDLRDEVEHRMEQDEYIRFLSSMLRRNRSRRQKLEKEAVDMKSEIELLKSELAVCRRDIQRMAKSVVVDLFPKDDQ